MISLLISVWTIIALGNNFLNASKFFGQSDFKWVDLQSHELSSWYTPADLCVMNNTHRSAFPQEVRAKNCSEFSRGSRRMFCGVGMGNNNYPCYGPYGAARPSFQRGLEGYTNASRKPLVEALETLITANATLVLAGDSTMRQKLQALQCELSREDRRIRFQGNIFGIVPCDTALKVFLPSGKSITVYAASLGPKGMECFPEQPSPTKVGVAMHLARIIQKINQQNTSVLLIANMGLWYNNEDEFAALAPQVLDYLLTLAEVPGLVNTLAWHETLTQHWVSPTGTGYFIKEVVDAQEKAWDQAKLVDDTTNLKEFMVPGCCAALTNYTLATDWRNGIVHRTMDKSPRMQKHIHLLPMASLTKDIPDMHTCNPFYKHDCTHYCYTPLLWQVLWHQIKDLAKVLEKKFLAAQQQQ